MYCRGAILLSALLVGACAQTNVGESDPLVTGSTAPGVKENAKAELPQCAQPLGTVALVERPISVLDDLGLPSPLPMLNTMISQSGCFQIVDQQAARLAQSKGGKGKGKAPTLDYLISADILAQNPDSGGINTGVISQFIPGIGGTVAGSVSVKTSDVRTALFLSDTKTGLQLTSVQGYAQTADFGASLDRIAKVKVKLGVYSDTPIGRTTSAAFLDAYIKLVTYVKASPKVAAKR
jgi:hypothetical protein